MLGLNVEAVGLERPDSGQAIRMIETSPLFLPIDPNINLTTPPASKNIAVDTDLTFYVQGFRLTGNESISTDELLAVLEEFSEKELDFNDLNSATQKLVDHYLSRGYILTQAILPPQRIRNGTVWIKILEGSYDQVILNNSSTINEKYLAPNIASLKSGDAVLRLPLETSLLTLSDIPGLDVRSTLKPGAHVGTSTLLIETKPGPLVTGHVDLDNYGSRFTGQNRIGTSININNPFGLADLINVRAMVSDEDQQYHRFSYQVPVWGFGTQVGVAYSDMAYQLEKDFEALKAHGSSRIHSIYVNHSLIRSRDINLFTRFEYDEKRLKDDIGLFDSKSDKKVRSWSSSLNGSYRDSVGEGGVSSFFLIVTHGALGIDRGQVERFDALSARSQGSFAKLNASFIRMQRLSNEFSFFTQFQGQLSNHNLNSSEKVDLGGIYGVRAYPQGEASGDRGWIANMELRYQAASALQLMAFADHGRVRKNNDTWVEGDNHRSLSAAGLGLTLSHSGWRLNGVAAWKLGNEKAESDVDRSPRVLAQLVKQF